MSAMRDLLAALAGVPVLPGAKCRGRAHLFDEARPDEAPDTAEQRHGHAVTLCRSCPALPSCSEWFDSLPRSKRPPGVVAGRIHPPQKRTRK